MQCKENNSLYIIPMHKDIGIERCQLWTRFICCTEYAICWVPSVCFHHIWSVMNQCSQSDEIQGNEMKCQLYWNRLNHLTPYALHNYSILPWFIFMFFFILWLILTLTNHNNFSADVRPNKKLILIGMSIIASAQKIHDTSSQTSMQRCYLKANC